MKRRASKMGAAELREHLGHPVIDADGHLIETAPVFGQYLHDYVRDIGGSDLANRIGEVLDFDETVLRPWSRMTDEEQRAAWTTRPPWWSHPAAASLDRATGHLPRLMYERLDDLGIDFAVLYPSRTLTTTAIREDELRQVACRALNAFNAEVYAEFQDRMTVVAHIPTHTPEEAIAALDHAVLDLGFKAIMFNGLVHRPIGDPNRENQGRFHWGSGSGDRLDTLGLDSEYDYDPFWARCVELKVAAATHTPGQGWGSRRSISSYMYNHIGSFAASMEAICKSLFMGGVTRRFPELSFGLLEGGVGWACTLYADIVGHWKKRNRDTIGDLDPAKLDTELVMQLFEKYGGDRFNADPDAIRTFFSKLEPEPPTLDEWSACEIDRLEDIRDLFVPSFYFGCEADDPSVAWAFNERTNPAGAKLRAMFSSDMSHWDVTNMEGILGDAYELVEEELVDDKDFYNFVFGNPARFYTSGNPSFFEGTRCQDQVESFLAETRQSTPPPAPGEPHEAA
ncbi:amidohydrolase [Myxococcota bacterium]|nr:amidohydrolase [Myxococcota bacterium]